MLARPSGSFVKVTLPSFDARGRTSVSMNCVYWPETVSYSRPRSLPLLSPPPELSEFPWRTRQNPGQSENQKGS